MCVVHPQFGVPGCERVQAWQVPPWARQVVLLGPVGLRAFLAGREAGPLPATVSCAAPAPVRGTAAGRALHLLWPWLQSQGCNWGRAAMRRACAAMLFSVPYFLSYWANLKTHFWRLQLALLMSKFCFLVVLSDSGQNCICRNFLSGRQCEFLLKMEPDSLTTLSTVAILLKSSQ